MTENVDIFELIAVEDELALEGLPEGSAFATLSSVGSAACASCPSTTSTVGTAYTLG